MLPPLIQRPGRSALSRQRERGVTMALVALAMFSLIAMAALSIDFGTLYEASAEAQRAADAAALAAARTISMSGITGDPDNSTGSWQQICGGGTSPATQTAIVVAQESTVGGAVPPLGSIGVTYSAGSAAPTGATDCSTLMGTSFGVNPVVTVKVAQPNLQTYFSRIWGATGHSVSATASAEVFNPSGSDTYAGQVVPVQPRCVKPWMVPNSDPINTTPGTFVSTADGTITTPGVSPNGKGVIGERFWLVPDCNSSATSTCAMFGPPGTQPKANGPNLATGIVTDLQYVPGQANFSSIAVPADGSTACSAVAATGTNYAPAIAGCDQSTQYQCGKIGANVVDLSENPAAGDSMNGVQCLIRASNPVSVAGQDWLAPSLLLAPTAPPTYPFQIQAGTNNPLVKLGLAAYGDLMTSSTSILSLPIYDNSAGAPPINATGTTNVTVVGFLQVFVYATDQYGDLNVAVMNVSGCGNAAPNPNYLTGTSPVPVRLITPP